jgi:hypothetical protein
MTGLPAAQAGTALSPEWDRWFDEAFSDLISGDDDLVRAEFDALIAAGWPEPPPSPPPPAPSAADPSGPPADGGTPEGRSTATDDSAPGAPVTHERSPPA